MDYFQTLKFHFSWKDEDERKTIICDVNKGEA
jgi:hypothetical protein